MLSLGQKSFRKELFIGFGPQNVFIYIVLDLGFHFRTEGFNHFCGGSQNQGIGWDDHALGYHRVGADDAVFADLGVVEYGGVDPTTGKYIYRFNTPDALNIYDDRAISRWSLQVGFRYKF